MINQPTHLDLKKEEGLSIEWSDGSTDFLSIAYLRRMSPSADAKKMREEMARNPLTVLTAGTGSAGPLKAIDAQLVGNYAIKIQFSDGHDTGLYTWSYLKELASSHKGNS